jgi:hypothetical protein
VHWSWRIARGASVLRIFPIWHLSEASQYEVLGPFPSAAKWFTRKTWAAWFAVNRRFCVQDLEHEAGSKLSDPWSRRAAAIHNFAQIRFRGGAGAGIAVAIEDINHVVANVQFEPAVGSEREILVNADVPGC